MYKIGDLIMYGVRGVCRVKEITELDWSSAEQGRKYYVLEPLYKDDLIYVPIDNVKVFMRPVMSRVSGCMQRQIKHRCRAGIY